MEVPERERRGGREATERVGEAIDNSQKGAALSRDLRDGLTELVGVVRHLGESVRTIAEASRQQQADLARVSDAVGQMSSLGQANAEEAAAAETASQHLRDQAVALQQTSADLAALFESHAPATVGDIAARPGIARRRAA